MYKTDATVESATTLLRTLAEANGGWLNSKDYERMTPPNSPSFLTMYKLFGVNSWNDICAKVGIYASYGDTLPPVLDDTLIREVIRRSYKGATMYSIAHRQQVALWCLKQAEATLGPTFTKSDYEGVYKELGLAGSWVVSAAFEDSWTKAVVAAGLAVVNKPKPNSGRKNSRQISEMNEHQQAVIDGMIVEAVPADWRLHEWPMTALDTVTEVTQVYRHAQVAEFGLRHSEVRMMIR